MDADDALLFCERERALEILEVLEADPHNFDLTRHPPKVTTDVLAVMFEKQGLLEPFGVSRPQFQAFAHDLCDEYAVHPFHSFTHAVDVAAGAYIGLRQLGDAELLQQLSQFALLLAAAGHDTGHPGTHHQCLPEGGPTLECMHTKLALSRLSLALGQNTR
jgi:hypothetical protein